MSKISRNDLRFLLLEGFMVLFGVFCALVLEGWREDVQARGEAAAALDRVGVEVRANLDELRSLDSTVSHRLVLLDSVAGARGANQSLAELVGSFEGYRTPDLSGSAWQRLSTGSVADHVPLDRLQDGFTLYSLHRYFSRLDEEINRLVYSETFHDPSKFGYAVAISRRIMQQQIVWAREVIPRHETFLATHRAP